VSLTPSQGAVILIFSLATALAVVAVASGEPAGTPAQPAANPYARWSNGPPKDPSFFPIAVWLQSPAMARRYHDAGINLYVGLWKGPTEQQLAELKAAGMPVFCEQNEIGLKHVNDPTIIGWMHGDEPDNAQPLAEGKGYGPPVPPEKIVAQYRLVKERDPSRPVMLNLGQGVAWDGWYGRGIRTNHPEDYPEYIKGCDIVSFDIYPVVHGSPEVAGNLWYVARGVQRLAEWSAPGQVVWNCIECTRISSDRKPAPHQVRAEVWISLIHGSMGLLYFVHEWKPRFNEHALPDDPEMLAAVTAINRQIRELAPVLNSPAVPGSVRVTSSNSSVPIAAMAKRYGGPAYVFAVGMRDGQTTGTFKVTDLPQAASAEVLGEGRTIPVRDGTLEDAFGPYDVHLYRIR